MFSSARSHAGDDLVIQIRLERVCSSCRTSGCSKRGSHPLGAIGSFHSFAHSAGRGLGRTVAHHKRRTGEVVVDGNPRIDAAASTRAPNERHLGREGT
jgi:hypothetical protein